MDYHIAIGADHRGFEIKAQLLQNTELAGHTVQWHDVGTFTADRTDYPIYAKKVADLILNNTAKRGILLCGSGIGMVIAANRFKGIYAGIAWNQAVARSAAQDDNVNVLALPVDFIQSDEVPAIIKAWLSATFKEGRYQERLDMLDNF